MAHMWCFWGRGRGRARRWRWWAMTSKISPSLLTLIPPLPLISCFSSLATLSLTLVPSPCCPVTFPEQAGDFLLSVHLLIRSLADSVGGPRVPVSLDVPFPIPWIVLLFLHPAESHTSSRPSSSSDFFNGVIFNFHRKDLEVQWRFVLICGLQKGEGLTCGTSLTESPFLFWSSSLRLKCFPWVMICWMLRDSLDLGCYWILLEWICHSDEITTWQFYESLFLSSFFDQYSRRHQFNSQPSV